MMSLLRYALFRGRRVLVYCSVAVVLGGIACALYFCHCFAVPSGDKAPVRIESARPVKVETVTPVGIDGGISYPGIVKASRAANLAFRVSGPLVEVSVKPGDIVEEGAVLMRIDPRDYENAVSSAESQLSASRARLQAMRAGARSEDIKALEAQLAAALASLEKARLDFGRAERLYSEKVIPKADFDGAQSSLAVAEGTADSLRQNVAKAKAGARSEDIAAAEAEIQGLETRLRVARDQLADTYLRAPFAGVITRQYVENYEMVQAGAGVISLHDISELEIEVNVPEIELIHETDWEGYEAVAVFPAIRDRRFSVRLKEYNTDADPLTRTYSVTFAMPSPDGVNILPGMTAEVSRQRRAGVPAGAEVIAVPVSAVVSTGERGDPHVWLLPAGASTAERRFVKLGGTYGDGRLLVVAGLAAGDRVVVGGSQFVADGMPLRPM